MKARRKKWAPTIVEWEPIFISSEEHRKRLAEVGEIIYCILRKSRRLTRSESIEGKALETESNGSTKQGAA